MIKTTAQKIYVALIFIFMYAPIATLMVLSFNASRTARCMWNQNSGSVSSVTVRMPLTCSSLACSVILTAPFVPRVCCGQGRLSCHVWQPALETLLFPHTFLDQPRFLYFI